MRVSDANNCRPFTLALSNPNVFTVPRAHFIGRSKPHRLISKIFTHVFACAETVDDMMAESFAVRQSKTILARSCGAGRPSKNWQRNGNDGSFPSKIVDFESSASATSANCCVPAAEGGHTNPRLSSSSHGIPFSSQIFSQFNLHLGCCLKRHWIQMLIKLRH